MRWLDELLGRVQGPPAGVEPSNEVEGWWMEDRGGGVKHHYPPPAAGRRELPPERPLMRLPVPQPPRRLLFDSAPDPKMFPMPQ